jgi:hypothetical protein
LRLDSARSHSEIQQAGRRLADASTEAVGMHQSTAEGETIEESNGIILIQ